MKQGYFDYNQIISISITYGTVKYQLYTMYTAFEISFGYMKQKSLYQVSYTYIINNGILMNSDVPPVHQLWGRFMECHIDGLTQDWSIATANAPEIPQFCARTSTYLFHLHVFQKADIMKFIWA